MNFVTNLQSAKQVVPAVGALDNPTPRLESRIRLTLLFFLAARFDVSDVSSTFGRPAQLRIVVAFVAAQMLARLFLGRRSRDGHGIQRRTEHFHVVPVGARECRGQWYPVGVGKVVPLGAQFTAIGGVFSSLVPPLTGAEIVAESSDWKLQSIPLRSS